MKSFHIHPRPDLDPTSFSNFLKEVLESRGYLEVEEPLLADQIYVLEHPRNFSRDKRVFSRSGGEKILLRFEPKVVNPILYRKRTEDFYSKIINVGSKNHKGVRNRIVRWPYFLHPNPAKPLKKFERDSPRTFSSSLRKLHSRSIVISMVVANKVSWSKGSNYSKRREIALRAASLGVRVFGMGWQSSLAQKLSGNFRLFLFFISQGVVPSIQHVFENLIRPTDVIPHISDKFDVLLDSQFHIAIENSSSYVSEKLLDSLVAGSIPIYMGPSLGEYGIPEDCYIPLVKVPRTREEIQNLLANYDHLRLEKRIRDFVFVEDGLQSWHPKAVAESMVDLCTTN